MGDVGTAIPLYHQRTGLASGGEIHHRRDSNSLRSLSAYAARHAGGPFWPETVWNTGAIDRHPRHGLCVRVRLAFQAGTGSIGASFGLGRREFCRRTAASQPLVSPSLSRRGDGHCRCWQYGRCIGFDDRANTGGKIRLAGSVRVFVNPAIGGASAVWHHGEGRSGKA